MSVQQRKVVLAIDGSDHSLRGLAHYVAHLRKENDLVVVLSHLQPEEYLVPLEGGFVSPESCALMLAKMKDGERQAKELGMEVSTRLNAAEVAHRFIYRLSSESTGAFIARTAEEEGAGLIVLGSRGQGLLRRTFLGSVCDFVLHHTSIPVCVVPPPKHG